MPSFVYNEFSPDSRIMKTCDTSSGFPTGSASVNLKLNPSPLKVPVRLESEIYIDLA